MWIIILLDLVLLIFESGHHLFGQNYAILGQVFYLSGGQGLSSYEIICCFGCWLLGICDTFTWWTKHLHSPASVLLPLLIKLTMVVLLLWLLGGDLCDQIFRRLEWIWWNLLLWQFLFVWALLHGLLTSSSCFCCSIQKLISGRLWLIDVIQIADYFLRWLWQVLV